MRYGVAREGGAEGEVEDNSRLFRASDAREATATSKLFAIRSFPSFLLPLFFALRSSLIESGVWQLMNCPSAVATYSRRLGTQPIAVEPLSIYIKGYCGIETEALRPRHSAPSFALSGRCGLIDLR